MGKTGKWFKSFLGRKKDKGDKDRKENASDASVSASQVVVVVPRPTTPKENKRWSFRRSSASNNSSNSNNNSNSDKNNGSRNNNNTANANVADALTNSAAAVDAVPKTSEEPPEISQITPLVSEIVEDITSSEVVEVRPCSPTLAVTQDEAAVKIQAVYRSYLAKKALKALRGLVKLQALVRGHLVRKQASATLRCMQALMIAQARVRAQRIVGSEHDISSMNHRQLAYHCNNLDKTKYSYHDMEENIKIVEMDRGELISNGDSMSSYSIPGQHLIDNRIDNRISLTTYLSPVRGPYMKLDYQQYSPAPSTITDISPRTCSGHFEDYSFATPQSSSQCYSAMSRHEPSRAPFSFPKADFAENMSCDFPLYPNYMANTKSSKAKARSQSAPRQRVELERQPSRGRRPSVEGRNIPKGAKMQRSSSQVGAAAHNFQYPWSVKLDKSIISLNESECGSTCSVATTAYYPDRRC